jgi:hypothetical protein
LLTKWVYHLKSRSGATLVKYKVCLVACGNEQHGMDFQETFALVAKWSIIRSLVSLAIEHSWEILHMDVKFVFFNRQIREDVYVKQPCGFIIIGLECKVCKLKKALYGLHQLPCAWHE